MSVTLTEAVEACEERLQIILGAGDEEDIVIMGGTLEEDQVRKMASGFDLDLDELNEITNQKTNASLMGLISGKAGLVEIVHGMYFQGLIEGLKLAELRAKVGDG